MTNKADYNVILGDCLGVMKTLPDASQDLVFTSPPYNLGNYAGSKPNFHAEGKGMWKKAQIATGYDSHSDNMPTELYIEWQHNVLRECWRLLSDDGAIFYNHKPRSVKKVLTTPLTYIPAELMGNLRQIIIWDRGNGMNFNNAYFQPVTEWIVVLAKPGFKLLTAGGGYKDVWRVNADRGSDHPAPFPVELPRRAIEASGAQRIFDPFSGSGTTGVAALELGRQYTGIELDAGYRDASINRLSKINRGLFDGWSEG